MVNFQVSATLDLKYNDVQRRVHLVFQPVVLAFGALGFLLSRLALQCPQKEQLDVQATAKLGPKLFCANSAYGNAAEMVCVLYRTCFFIGLEMVEYGVFSRLHLKLTSLVHFSFLQKSFRKLFGNIGIYLLDQMLNQCVD